MNSKLEKSDNGAGSKLSAGTSLGFSILIDLAEISRVCEKQDSDEQAELRKKGAHLQKLGYNVRPRSTIR